MKYYIHTVKGFVQSNQCYTLNPFNIKTLSALDALKVIKQELITSIQLQLSPVIEVIDEDDICDFMSVRYPNLNIVLPEHIESELEELAISFMSQFN